MALEAQALFWTIFSDYVDDEWFIESCAVCFRNANFMLRQGLKQVLPVYGILTLYLVKRYLAMSKTPADEIRAMNIHRHEFTIWASGGA